MAFTETFGARKITPSPSRAHSHPRSPMPSGMLGRSPLLTRLADRIHRVADSDCPVLITGETGTGKELVARALHNLSGRRRRRFEDLNCGAMSEALVLSELFGHERGAFTGADQRRSGALERADGGTLFLDEIGDLPLSMQAALLRVLETGEFRRVGGEGKLPSRFRLVCATHKNLLDEACAARFRQDLYFRIGVIVLEVPPLRERPEDIPLLANHFLKVWSRERDLEVQAGIGGPAMEKLLYHHWPGNVRELKNVIQRAATEQQSHRSPIDAQYICFNPYRQSEGSTAGNAAPDRCAEPGEPTGVGQRKIRIGGRALEEIKREIIMFEVMRNGGNLAAAARSLSMPKQTLHDYCRRMAINNRALSHGG